MTTEINYQKQATDFLKETNTHFSCSFKKNDYYFPEDKEPRDIYTITLKNEKHRYRFTFGQSIANTGTAPTPYDVMAGITNRDPGTFKNFCSDFGYDSDSIKAHKVYEAVIKEWKNIQLLFTEEELEKLQEIN